MLADETASAWPLERCTDEQRALDGRLNDDWLSTDFPDSS
jgi:hypothetical protein